MINEASIDRLREQVRERLTGARLSHTLGVEKMAVYLGELYAPEKNCVLRAAALLHDITKPFSYEKQLQICEKIGIIVPCELKNAPKTLHAITAAGIIPSEYPDFADDEIIDAVRWHTTGRANMSITEKLIYLADFIEETRTYDDCVLVRDHFFDASPEKMSPSERLWHLDDTLLLSFDITMRQLIDEDTPIATSTCEARNYIISSLREMTAPNK